MRPWQKKRVVLAIVILACVGVGLWYLQTAVAASRPVQVALSAAGGYQIGFGFDPTQTVSWTAAASAGADLFVTYDKSTHKIHTFSLKGEPIASFGGQGMMPGAFMEPAGLAIDAGGNILVADASIPVIRRYDRQGTFVDQLPEVPGIKGWSRVAVAPDGSILACPDVHAALLDREGVRRFNASGEISEVCTNCMGPLAADKENNVYMINMFSRDKEVPTHVLQGYGPGNRLILDRQHPDVKYKPAIHYWPEANMLVVTNAGERRVEAYGVNGRPLEPLVTVPPNDKPPIAALPAGNMLLVLHHDGEVRLYTADLGTDRN